jgi:hypothetical protein
MTTPIQIQAIRQATLDQISADIRRVAGAHVEVTADVALSNWRHFFDLGQYREAARWWSIVHERLAQGAA